MLESKLSRNCHGCLISCLNVILRIMGQCDTKIDLRICVG